MTNKSIVYFRECEFVSIERHLVLWLSEFAEMGVLALFSEAEKDFIPEFQDLCNRLNIPICGAFFPQLIYETAFYQTGLVLLRFDRMPYVSLVTDIRSDNTGAVETAELVANSVGDYLGDDEEATLFLILDGLLPNVSSLLDELYLRLANRVHYAGVNAGSESFQPMPCVFDNQRLVDKGLLVILMKPHYGAVLEHGYQTTVESLPATSTDRNRIIQIDWRPAFEVYRELVFSKFGIEITRENFYEYAVHFPFGILRANHNIVVRIPVALDEDNALYCIGEVPAHSMLTLLDAPQVNSQSTVQSLEQHLTQMSGDSTNKALLLFYCAGRKLHLGDTDATNELHLFKQFSNASVIAGGLALGEIGDTTLWGYPLFHNATLVTTIWSSTDNA